ncbi:MAG: epoxyqueuosine reductase QueH [Lachnospiraceae bacterium]|jgi:predicted adenine nucleotide alpha hydrolase (AANH) superfamily ATPase|nr:epoxyqueuosine reductase QueH [Lachnospiraceae bacterium]MEE3461299.1 epoxyqueuosine reductase QueH [Lachnospiraceae bacterium]
MNKINYQKEMESILKEVDKNAAEKGVRPRLALHVCCAPCSSWCLTVLKDHFDIDCVYYNPNISPEKEFEKRLGELERFTEEFPHEDRIRVIRGTYDNDAFNELIKGMEDLPEGGERCFACYRMRLEYTVKYALEHDCKFFTTTLSLSPYKNSQVLNEIGADLSKKYGIPYLYSDFKKKNGYKESIELSKEYGLYRQNYCGCVFSLRHDLIGLH